MHHYINSLPCIGNLPIILYKYSASYSLLTVCFFHYRTAHFDKELFSLK